MRSLLIQASTVEKAVDKAWTDAGKPTEFTIKVLDFGEKGFFGITKRLAIVSIMYEPQKQTAVSKSQPTYQKKKATKQYPHHTKPKKAQFKTQDTKSQITRSERPSKEDSYKTPQKKVQPKPMQQALAKERIFWTDEMTLDISTWLKEAAKIIGAPTSINAQVNKKALTLTFNGDVLASPDEERLLFSSLSYLMIQLLKKKYKKKFQGYQLIITSKRFEKK